MLKQPFLGQSMRTSGKLLPLVLLLCGILISSGCSNPFVPSKKTIKTIDGQKIDLNDATVKQYVEEWHNAKPSIERLTQLENDLVFLLAEVSKLSDLGQVPGLARAPGSPAPGAAPGLTTTGSTQAISTSPVANGQSTVLVPSTGGGSTQVGGGPLASGSPGGYSTGYSAGYVNPSFGMCPEPFAHNYKKSVAFVSFPRLKPASSNLGALHNVENHLPMLIGANLRNRHGMLTPVQLGQAFSSANERGEAAAAAQAQALARQHRAQFFITGEVDDMSGSSANAEKNPGFFSRMVDGARSLVRLNKPLDNRSRVFTFNLHVRDGLTGQLLFTHQYSTFADWQNLADNDRGFGSPRFWATEYGKQVQYLVAQASDDLANLINCQPYMARVDSRPGRQQIVIHSGSNNGLRSGDSMELYQVVYEPVNGEYQQFDTRLIKRNGKVYLTETYPSHSIGHVVDEPLLNGQYVVRAL